MTLLPSAEKERASQAFRCMSSQGNMAQKMATKMSYARGLLTVQENVSE